VLFSISLDAPITSPKIHPVENISVKSLYFIDCIVTTESGKELATLQAAHQFKLYTGLDFPF